MGCGASLQVRGQVRGESISERWDCKRTFSFFCSFIFSGRGMGLLYLIIVILLGKTLAFYCCLTASRTTSQFERVYVGDFEQRWKYHLK